MRQKPALAPTGAAAPFAPTACRGGTATAPNARVTLDPANPVVVAVGASAIMHAMIPEFDDEHLALNPGVDLETTEIDD